jgi:integrase
MLGKNNHLEGVQGPCGEFTSPCQGGPDYCLVHGYGTRRDPFPHWPQVDMKKRIIRLAAEYTKDREPRTIPICEKSYQVLEELPRGLHNDHVFLYQGMSIKSIRASLIGACKTAGINYGRFLKDGSIFHDLRHTFNTNMRKVGNARSVRMAITGHSTGEMDNRYDTVDEQDMRTALGRMTSFLAKVDQNANQRWN